MTEEQKKDRKEKTRLVKEAKREKLGTKVPKVEKKKKEKLMKNFQDWVFSIKIVMIFLI